jgi:hypothetical protein
VVSESPDTDTASFRTETEVLAVGGELDGCHLKYRLDLSTDSGRADLKHEQGGALDVILMGC